MPETWEYHLTAAELHAFLTGALMLKRMGLKMAQATASQCLNIIADAAHSRLTEDSALSSSAGRKLVVFRDFPGLLEGAGDGNRTRIASLEGGGPDIRTSI